MYFSAAFIAAALPFLAHAAPAPAPKAEPLRIPLTKRAISLTNSDGTANIQAIQQSLDNTRAKINRGNSIIAANTGSSPVDKRASGTDSLTADGTQLWYGTISVGTPSVDYTVDFDTGSSDLFLPGPSCDSSCSGHKVYDPSQSSTSSDVGKTFSLSYGDGSTVSGEQYLDTVQIAGLTANSQTLGAAKTYSSGFSSSNFPADGLLGMAFPSLSVYNANPFFQTLVQQGTTDSSVFGFKLTQSGAELVIGADDSNYASQLTYTPVTTQDYWRVNADSLSVGGQQVVGSKAAIIDSGTTLVVGDTNSVGSFYSAFGGQPSSAGQGFYSFPCNNVPQDISVSFGGGSFPISASAFNLGPESQGSSNCVGGIMADDSIGSQFWIYGDVFMTNVYTSFDVGNGRVGFATL